MKELNGDKIHDMLVKQKEFIISRFYVLEIGLFGSFASGDNTGESDIDILVDFKKGHKDFFNYMRLKHFLERLFNKEVDLVMKTAVKPRLRETISEQVQYV